MFTSKLVILNTSNPINNKLNKKAKLNNESHPNR